MAFTIFPLWKAQAIINQQEKKQPLNKKHADSFANSPSNIFVNYIVNSNDLSYILKNKITKTQNSIGSSGIFLFSTLSEAIKGYYSVSEITKDKDETLTWIIKFLNEISYYFEEKLVQKQLFKTKRDTWIIDATAVHFYIGLSKKLYNSENWKDQLNDILDNIDFDKSNSPLKNYARKPKMAASKLLESMVD